MNNLKNEIFDRVNSLRFTHKKGAEFIQKQLIKELEKDVPLELIYEIIEDIKKGKNVIGEITDMVKDISGFDDPIRKDASMDLNQTKEIEKKHGGLKEFVKETDDKPTYDYNVEADSYVFYNKDGFPHPVPRTTIKAIFESFTTRGKNLSSDEIISEFQLTPEARIMIKNATRLYKTSLPDDPETVRQLDNPEDMQKYAEEKTKRLKDSEMRKIYDDTEKRFKDSKIKEFAKTNRGYDLFMDKLERVIKLYEPREFKDVEIPKINNNMTKSVIFGDAHLGKKGTDGIVIRIKKMTKELLNSPEKNIDITFLGDIGESFVPFPGSMHPDQRLGMEDINTEDLVMLAVDVLEQMLLTLYKSGKKITFNGLGGNHGRLTERKEFDPHRSAEMIIYRFLQKIVEDTNIKINILRDNMNIIKSGNVKFVYLHGDELTPAKLQRIAMQELEDNYFLCICSGDRHHLKITEISDRITRIQSPSLSGKGRFDESLALSSLSGYIELTKNNDGLVDINVKRLR